MTDRSIRFNPSSTFARIPSCWVNFSSVKSSIARRKKGALGGSSASNSFDARLFTPRAPMPCHGVGNREALEWPSLGISEGMVTAAHSLARSRKVLRAVSRRAYLPEQVWLSSIPASPYCGIFRPEPSDVGPLLARSIRSLLRPFLLRAFALLSELGSSLPVFNSGIGAGGAGGGGGGGGGGAFGEDMHIFISPKRSLIEPHDVLVRNEQQTLDPA